MIVHTFRIFHCSFVALTAVIGFLRKHTYEYFCLGLTKLLFEAPH